MDDIITINKNDILKFATEGSKLVIKKDAENQLIRLLDLKDFIDKTIDEVKQAIASSGKKAVGDDFKGIFGSRLKAIFRSYGDRYSTTNKEFIKEIKIERADSGKIDEYISQKGELPPDTQENTREGKLVIQRINEEQRQIAT